MTRSGCTDKGPGFGGWTPDLIERLAEAAHDNFRVAMQARGYVYGPITDDASRTHNALLPYAALTEEARELSRQFVRAIPNKLSTAAYRIVEVGAPPAAAATAEFPAQLIERMAEDEHSRWVRAKIAHGWRYAPATDKGRKVHASMVPWSATGIPSHGAAFSPEELTLIGPGELADDEREKDRVMVRSIPQILANAGLVLQEVPSAACDPLSSAQDSAEFKAVPGGTAP